MWLFALCVLIGAGVAHYRAEPGSFYGIDLSSIFPSNLLRAWHLQTAIFWIATSYVAGALFVAELLGGSSPRGQAFGIHGVPTAASDTGVYSSRRCQATVVAPAFEE